RRLFYLQIAAGTAAPQKTFHALLYRGLLSPRAYVVRRFALDDFNRVAAANLPRLNHAAENASTPAQRFLKSLPDRFHLVARLAFLRDFQQRFAHANSLAHQ